MISVAGFSVEVIQSLILAFLFWSYFFFWAPLRAVRVGAHLDDPPLSLRMKPFMILRTIALFVMLGIGFSLPLETELRSVDYQKLLGDVLAGERLGAVLAITLTAVLLWAWPEMTAQGRIRRDLPPGEWQTPMLVFFRWIWLGIVFLACLGFWQQLPFGDLLGEPLSPTAGVMLALAGAVLFVIFWGLPGMMVARRADEGDPHALEALSRVRWRGLPSYLAFIMKHRGTTVVESRQRPQKLCPSCMRPTDIAEKYETLRFDLCPHCGETIPPVVKLADYISQYAERIRQMQAGRGKTRGRNQKTENDMVQRVLRAMLTLAVRERGTDLHLQVENGRFIIRCRTDGVLFTMLDLPEELQRPMISSIKVQSNMDIAERRKPQDGTYKAIADDIQVDVRVNTSPVASGEAASLRLLYRQQVLGSLEKLGIGRRNYRILTEAINHPHGLILVTGPTGSGKSTTLYNALGTIADGQRNIITLEDPIEFKIEGLTQMQVDASKGFSFASGLRSILRQDPDVIMVGEIRDADTAKMAIDAAMTGHLVFSSLHTIDTFTAIGRLADLGVDPHRYADALLLIIAQRLVRLNCPRCSREVDVAAEELAAVGLPGAPEQLTLKRGEGCDHCHESGYYDREGIYEIFTANGDNREMIANRNSPMEIRRMMRGRGMRTLLEDGLTKVLLGRTTVEEVLRVTS